MTTLEEQFKQEIKKRDMEQPDLIAALITAGIILGLILFW